MNDQKWQNLKFVMDKHPLSKKKKKKLKNNWLDCLLFGDGVRLRTKLFFFEPEELVLCLEAASEFS